MTEATYFNVRAVGVVRGLEYQLFASIAGFLLSLGIVWYNLGSLVLAYRGDMDLLGGLPLIELTKGLVQAGNFFNLAYVIFIVELFLLSFIVWGVENFRTARLILGGRSLPMGTDIIRPLTWVGAYLLAISTIAFLAGAVMLVLIHPYVSLTVIKLGYILYVTSLILIFSSVVWLLNYLELSHRPFSLIFSIAIVLHAYSILFGFEPNVIAFAVQAGAVLYAYSRSYKRLLEKLGHAAIGEANVILKNLY
ncbi:MAG: hypothetical protein F7C09_03015 [Aeropyrum sp.]|nr:hypothetical protein [Aeropyrum sp.]